MRNFKAAQQCVFYSLQHAFDVRQPAFALRRIMHGQIHARQILKELVSANGAFQSGLGTFESLVRIGIDQPVAHIHQIFRFLHVGGQEFAEPPG